MRLGYGLDDHGFEFRQKEEVLPFFIIYVPFLLMGTRISFLEVKRPGCEADHSPQSSAEAEYYCSYTSPPSYVTRILAYTEASLLQTTPTDYVYTVQTSLI